MVLGNRVFDSTDYLYAIGNDTGTYGMFVASPHDWSSTSIWTVNSDGACCGYFNNPGDSVGFRPLICLSQDVKLEKDGDNYKIVSGARPTFIANTEHLQNETSKITISNIKYNEKKNITNWQVKYKKSNEENWQTSNSLSFTVNNGIYNIKIVNGNIESKEKKIYVGDNIELDYIQFTGTQYIDTEIVPLNHTTEVEFNFDEYSTEFLFGTIDGYYHLHAANNQYRWGTGANDSFITAGTWTTGKHKLIFNGENHLVKMDDTVLGTDIPLTSSKNLYIGTRIYNGNIQLPLQGKIYYFRITDKSTGGLVRNFVPSFNTTTKSAGLYDTIEKKFYGNNGTGNIIAGPEANN